MSAPTADQPFSVSFYWGSTIETGDIATTREFSNVAEHDAYMKGVSEGLDYFDATFLESPDYRVDSEGDIVPRKLKNPSKTSPTDRYVIWGENREPGDKAQTYSFDTAAEAQAFQDGAEDIVGWTTYFEVPDPSFKPYENAKAALEAISPQGQEALREYMRLEDDDLNDRIFVRDDGAFVDTEWGFGTEISNAPLERDEWVKRFDEAAKQHYCTSIEDMGLDDPDVDSWMRSYKRDPEAAMHAYAEKYDLSPLERKRGPSF